MHSQHTQSGHLETELLKQPALAIPLLVLVLENATCSLQELLLRSLIRERIGSQMSLESLDHNVLNRIPGGHDVCVVHDLDEGLHTRPPLNKLLQLWGRLAHALGDWQGGSLPPSSLTLRMTAFLPAYRPWRQTTIFPSFK